jgi:hypothetical protein
MFTPELVPIGEWSGLFQVRAHMDLRDGLHSVLPIAVSAMRPKCELAEMVTAFVADRVG